MLITGAAGGVGRFAIQLAHRAGAHVTGVVRSPERGEGLRELGADELITELDARRRARSTCCSSPSAAPASGPRSPASRRRGTVVAFGASTPEPTTFDVSAFYNRRGADAVRHARLPRARDRPLRPRATSAFLVGELAAGRLDPQIALTGSWREPDAALAALIDRRVAGKAVLQID